MKDDRIAASVVGPDPVPHEIEWKTPDSDPHHSNKLAPDPDPHKFADDKPKGMENDPIRAPPRFCAFIWKLESGS